MLLPLNKGLHCLQVVRYTGQPYPAEGQTFADAHFGFSSSTTSLIVSILSAGTFFGAILAGDIADMVGRRTTVVVGEHEIYCLRGPQD